MNKFKSKLSNRWEQTKRCVRTNLHKIFPAVVFVLIIVSIALAFFYIPGTFKEEDGVSIFNLLVDVFVGLLTVFGLCWAVIEFAEKQSTPNLRR